MANRFEYSEEKRKQLEEWLSDKPDIIKELCHKYPPNKLYKLKETDQIVVLYSYYEDGTLTVVIPREYNVILAERMVYGVKPEELEECDLPTEDELKAITERNIVISVIFTQYNTTIH